SDCQGFMTCFVDSHPSYYLKPYQCEDGKDTVWALKYYWLNSGGYADQDFAPQAMCNELFRDDGAGNIIRPNALATRQDVFKHWGLHEDKVQLTMNPTRTDWYPGKSWHCSTNSKSKMIAAAQPALTQEQAASNQFAGISLAGEDIGALDLPNANLRGSNLEGTNLRAADLRSADLADANLTGANVQGADLTAADTTFAVGVDDAPLAAAKTSRSLLRFYTQTTLDQLALTAAAHAITGNVGSVPMNGFGNLVDALREGAGNFAQFIVPT